MKTSTLHHLIDSLAGIQRHHLASALLESDFARQTRAGDEARKVAAILDAIRFELSARETQGGRSAAAARRADHYLQRLLEDFLDVRELDGLRVAGSSSPARQEANAPVGTDITAVCNTKAEDSQRQAQRSQQRRQAGERNG